MVPSNRERKCKVRRGVRWLLLVFLGVLSSCGKSPGSSEASGERKDSEAGTSSSALPVEIISDSGIQMISLPGGEFMMGSNKGNVDEAPPHKVRLTPFIIDKYEVTHEMFAKAQLPNPSHWQDKPNKPVERVRWRDAKQYCNERSLLEQLKPCYNEITTDWDCDYSANGYRLPTEAEYAARAGARGPYDFGEADKLRLFGWFGANAEQKTHPAGQKRPNAWGL